VFTFLW